MRSVNLLQTPKLRSRSGVVASFARHGGTIIPLCSAAIWLSCVVLDVCRIRSAISTQRTELNRIRSMDTGHIGEIDSGDRLHDIIRELDALTHTAQIDHAIALAMNAAHHGIAFDLLTIESMQNNLGSIDAFARTLNRSYTIQIRGRGEHSIGIVRFAGDLADNTGFHSITTEQSPPNEPALSDWNNFLIRAQFVPTRTLNVRENQR